MSASEFDDFVDLVGSESNSDSINQSLSDSNEYPETSEFKIHVSTLFQLMETTNPTEEDLTKEMNIISGIMERAHRDDEVEYFSYNDNIVNSRHFDQLVEEKDIMNGLLSVALEKLKVTDLHLRIASVRVLSVGLLWEDFKGFSHDPNEIELSELYNYTVNLCYPLRVHATPLISAFPIQMKNQKTIYTHLCQRLVYHLHYRIVSTYNNKKCRITLSTLSNTLETLKIPNELKAMEDFIKPLQEWLVETKPQFMTQTADDLLTKIFTEGDPSKHIVSESGVESSWKHNMLVQLLSEDRKGQTGTLLGFTSKDGVVQLVNSTEIVQIPLVQLNPIEGGVSNTVSLSAQQGELYNPDMHELSYNDAFEMEFIYLLRIHFTVSQNASDLVTLAKTFNLFEYLIHYLLICDDILTIRYIFRVLEAYVPTLLFLPDFLRQYHGVGILLLFLNIASDCPSLCELLFQIQYYIVRSDLRHHITNLPQSVKHFLLEKEKFYLLKLNRNIHMVASCCNLLIEHLYSDDYFREFDSLSIFEEMMRVFLLGLDDPSELSYDSIPVTIPILNLVIRYVSFLIVHRCTELANKVYGDTINFQYKANLSNYSTNLPVALECVKKIVYENPREANEYFDLHNWPRMKALFIDTKILEIILRLSNYEYLEELDPGLFELTHLLLLSPSNYDILFFNNNNLLHILLECDEDELIDEKILELLTDVFSETHEVSCYLYRYTQFGKLHKNIFPGVHCHCHLKWEDNLKSKIRMEIREHQGFKKIKDQFSHTFGSDSCEIRSLSLVTILLGLCRESQIRMFFRLSLKQFVHNLLSNSNDNGNYDALSILYHNSLLELQYRLSDGYEDDLILLNNTVITKSQIHFIDNELNYLVYQYLLTNGLSKSAKILMEEGQLGSFLSCNQDNITLPVAKTETKTETKTDFLKLVGLKPSPIKRPGSILADNPTKMCRLNETRMSVPSTPTPKIKDTTIKLEDLAVDFLYNQHIKCPVSSTLLPSFSLLTPHKCPAVTHQSLSSPNFLLRTLTQELSTTLRSHNTNDLDYKYYYKRLSSQHDWKMEEKKYNNFVFLQNQYMLTSADEGDTVVYDITNRHFSVPVNLSEGEPVQDLAINFKQSIISLITESKLLFYKVISPTEYEIITRLDDVGEGCMAHYSDEFLCCKFDDFEENNSENGIIEIFDINTQKVTFSLSHQVKGSQPKLDYDDSKKLVVVNGEVIDIRSSKVVLDAHQLDDSHINSANLFHPNKPELIVGNYLWDLRKGLPSRKINHNFSQPEYEFNRSGNILLTYNQKDPDEITGNYTFTLFDSNYSVIKTKEFNIPIVRSHLHPDDMCIGYITEAFDLQEHNTIEYYTVADDDAENKSVNEREDSESHSGDDDLSDDEDESRAYLDFSD